MKILYWDAFAGISGDMALGSLIALGADPDIIIDLIHSIGLSEFKLNVKLRQIHGIESTDIDVVLEPLDGHKEGPKHRHLKDIQQMIKSGSLSERAQSNALSVFSALAEAEACVHGTTLDQVHFHEVGAVDSLVDIVGTCIALDLLDIDSIRVSKLPWSHGFVHCAHGVLPLPAPATLMLLRGFTLQESGINGELITPTGAALLKALAQQTDFPEMTLSNIGYGSGKNDYGIPSLLRAVIGES